MDIRLALMAGIDIPIPECQLTVHQPRLKEIAFVGEQEFFVGVQTLGLYKSMFVTEDKESLEKITNFQIFMTVMMEKTTADKKDAVIKVLSLLCPEYQVMFTPQSLILQGKETPIMIDENNFDALQDNLRQIFCFSNAAMDQTAFNPQNKKAKEIADKIMRGRQKIAAQSEKASGSTFAQYISTLAIGLHSMSVEDLLNCTMYQLYDLMERYSLYLNWDIDIRTRLTGGTPDSQPENWMKNIH